MPESPQMTLLNLVLGGAIFTEGGHYSPVNNVGGGIFGGDTVHYDTGMPSLLNIYMNCYIKECQKVEKGLRVLITLGRM